MQALKSFPWPAFAAFLAALGIVTTTDPQLAIVGAFGVLIVMLLNYLVRTFHVRIGAGWLTVFLYLVSTALAAAFANISLPPFPSFGGDPAEFMQGLSDFIQQTAPIAATITTSATLIYNSLKEHVFDKLLPVIDDIAPNPPEYYG
jgi:hypothetical protein